MGLRGIVANVLDWDIAGSEFKLQSRYFITFWINTIGKSKNSLIPLTMGLIVPLMSFYKNGIKIK